MRDASRKAEMGEKDEERGDLERKLRSEMKSATLERTSNTLALNRGHKPTWTGIDLHGLAAVRGWISIPLKEPWKRWRGGVPATPPPKRKSHTKPSPWLIVARAEEH
jgi:hypothetical protein